MLLVGFEDDETDVVATVCGDVARVLRLPPSALHLTPEQALSGDAGAPSASAPSAPGRVVLLSSADVAAHGANLKALLLEAGLQPAVYGALRPTHRRLPLLDVANSLLAAHESYHNLARPLRTVHTAWSPAAVRCALNATLCAFDPELYDTDDEDVAQLPRGAVVALDGLLSGAETRALLECMTSPGFDESSAAPPASLWERETRDTAAPGAAPTWGLSEAALLSLQGEAAPAAVVEVQSRLQLLFPEYSLCHMPGDAMEPHGEAPAAAAVAPLVANAAVCEDAFGWHRDAQPALLHPESPWAERHGLYANGAPGKPLLVSCVVYLNEDWPPGFDAETLFLDESTGAGLIVRPAPGRCVLMHQDLLHRLSAPSAAAGRCRYSLVWKLAVMPRHPDDVPCIARPEWGPQTHL